MIWGILLYWSVRGVEGGLCLCFVFVVSFSSFFQADRQASFFYIFVYFVHNNDHNTMIVAISIIGRKHGGVWQATKRFARAVRLDI